MKKKSVSLFEYNMNMDKIMDENPTLQVHELLIKMLEYASKVKIYERKRTNKRKTRNKQVS